MTNEQQLFEIIYDGLVNDAPSDILFAELSRHFQLSVYLCDLSGRVLIGDNTDRFYDFFQKRDLNNTFPAVFEQKAIWLENHEIDEKNYYLLRIGTQFGSMLIVIAYTDHEHAFLEQMGALLEKMFQYLKNRDSVLHDSNDSFSEWITHELLYENDDTVERVIQKSHLMRLLIKPPFRILHFSSDTYAINRSRIFHDISNLFPHSYKTTDGQSILAFLFFADAFVSEKDHICQQLSGFCEKYRLFCCISSSFSDLKSRKAYIEQVKTLCPVCRHLCPHEHVFFADDYYCEHLLELTRTNLEPGALELTAISYLNRIDCENGTNNLEILESYLNHQLNAAAAAREFFVDRTTLKYRLRKIIDTIHINIDEPRTAFALKLALILHRMEH